jgi:hypothetical protein
MNEVPNQSMEPTASRRTIKFHMTSTRQLAATRTRQLPTCHLGDGANRWPL